MASVNEARMPLLDHLRELRKRVLRSAIAVLVAFGGGWYFYDSIIVTLAAPVCDLKAAQDSGRPAVVLSTLVASLVLSIYKSKLHCSQELLFQLRFGCINCGPLLLRHCTEKKNAPVSCLFLQQLHFLRWVRLFAISFFQ